MRIDAYLQKSMPEVEWWYNQLDKEGVDAVRETLAAMGLQAFLGWRARNAAETARLMDQTRSQRGAMLRPLDAKDRHRILICAAHRARCGYELLRAASNLLEDSADNVRPTTMLFRSVAAAEAFLENQPYFWIWDDGTDPLGERQLDE